MIIITGAAGFIGSCVVAGLNAHGREDLVLVDDFSRPQKRRNYEDKRYDRLVDRAEFFDVADELPPPEGFLHLGARTDTAEQDRDIFDALNVRYSKAVWEFCTEKKVPLIYASSAATYGAGELGFRDAHDLVKEFEPLNPYGESKNEFDKWALAQRFAPPFWAGLKFFNVYGPNEYHKGRMASVVFHAFNQIRETGQLKLFRSHREEYADGEQARDFIYVKDVVNVMLFLLTEEPRNGIYNLGTGKARTFLDLGRAVFAAMGRAPDISFVDTPIDIRATYQYYTCAEMKKLELAGYKEPFTSLEDGVRDYVHNFLRDGSVW